MARCTFGYHSCNDAMVLENSQNKIPVFDQRSFARSVSGAKVEGKFKQNEPTKIPSQIAIKFFKGRLFS